MVMVHHFHRVGECHAAVAADGTTARIAIDMLNAANWRIIFSEVIMRFLSSANRQQHPIPKRNPSGTELTQCGFATV
jgi:hypothetical protein